jgi:hypothetical protein
VRKQDLPLFRISAVTGEGVDALLEAMWREIAAVRALPAPDEPPDDEGVDLLAAARAASPKPARANAALAPPKPARAKAALAPPKPARAKAALAPPKPARAKAGKDR